MLGSRAFGKFMLTSLLVATCNAQPVHLAHDERVYIGDDFRINVQSNQHTLQ